MKSDLPLDSASDAEVLAARQRMFLDFCALLDSEQMPYAILAGYRGYPEHIASDVDFLVSPANFDRLPGIFSRMNCIPGAQLVQVLQHETTAKYFVFSHRVGSRLAFLHPDAASNIRKDGRLWLMSESVLATRRMSPTGFWIPAARVEFEYYFVKRVQKGSLLAKHLADLAELLAADEGGCLEVLNGLARREWARKAKTAIHAQDGAWFEANVCQLRAQVDRSKPKEAAGARLKGRLHEAARVWRRLSEPSGLVVAVLGPDGSGKTTVLNHLEREFAPAFRQVHRFHLRPRFGTGSTGSVVTEPHGASPRGWAAGWAKMAWFLIDFWWGWLRAVWPASVRSTFVLFDRYFHDMLADPARYRLSEGHAGPSWSARLIPKPDLWLVLTAPADLLVARKGELTPAVARALNTRYEALAARLPGARLIQSGQPLEQVLSEAVAAVQGVLAERTARRLSSRQ